MTKPTAPAFTTIDPTNLDAVTGGASKADKEERIMDKLVSITAAVGELAANQQKPKGDAMSSMMPMLMMMMKKPGGAGGLF